MFSGDQNTKGKNMLTDEELAALETLEAKETIIRDRVRGVAHRHHTGFWLVRLAGEAIVDARPGDHQPDMGAPLPGHRR